LQLEELLMKPPQQDMGIAASRAVGRKAAKIAHMGMGKFFLIVRRR
jgi:hypothetical protein